MSYCRFHNTLQDLFDCQAVMFEDTEMDELSPAEERARQQLIRLCHDIAQDSEDEYEEMLEAARQRTITRRKVRNDNS